VAVAQSQHELATEQLRRTRKTLHRAIVSASMAGVSQAEIARTTKLSFQRIHQILASAEIKLPAAGS
jgi:DNA-binding transcriptional regulator LsrR (DeoR family)